MFAQSEYEKIFKEGPNGWEEFYKRYLDSGGFVGLSRVGFDGEKGQALMYMQHGCGGLCGTGHYIYLSKEKGIWKITKKYMAWIS